MEKIEGSKIIADFDGLKYSQDYESYDDTYFEWEKENDGVFYRPLERDADSEIGYVRVDGIIRNDYYYQTKYHTSWDWLHPAIEKINTLCKETGYPDILEISHLKLISTEISYAHYAVIEFITWYNQSKTQP